MLRWTVGLTLASVMACGAPEPPARDDPAGDQQAVESSADGDETTVKKQFSRRLSPQARKAALMAGDGERVRALVQVASSADVEALEESLTAAGAEVGAWMEETRLLTVEIAPGQLEMLAELPGVVYVEVATPYRP